MAANDTFSFGSGNIWCTELTDATGATVSLPSPFLIGTLQDASVDFSWDNKPLFGQNTFAVTTARGKGKISSKIKFARLDGLLFNQIITGQPITSSTAGINYDTTGTTIPGSPYSITPTIPNSGTFGRILAVRDSVGNSYLQVASGPTTGQYALTSAVTGATASFATNVMTVTVAGTGNFAIGQQITSAGVAPGTVITSLGTGTGGTGTYILSTSPGTISAQAVTAGVAVLFAAADTGKTVYVDYAYTATSTVNKKVLVTNSPMGLSPTFRIDYLNPRAGSTLTLFAAMVNKFAYATKQDDWTINELDIEAFADSTNNVYQWGLAA